MVVQGRCSLLLILLLVILVNRPFSQTEITRTELDGNLRKQVHVGVLLNMGSWTGKIGHNCISMAISDFYVRNRHHKTRIILHTMDTRGDPFLALSTAVKQIGKGNLQVLLTSAETPLEERLLGELGVGAEIPILSFSPTSYSLMWREKYPYLIRFSQDVPVQIKGIASLLEAFKLREISFVYQETDNDQEIISYMVGSLQDVNIHIAQKIPFGAKFSQEQIIKKFREAKSLKINVFVVHATPSLASLLFLNAKKLGMMQEGYLWIVTDRTMNFLHLMDQSAIKSMQGVLGFRPYIESSSRLHNVVSQLRRNLVMEEDTKFKEMVFNAYGVWAYDAIWAVALAAERARNRTSQLRDHEELGNILTSRGGSVFLEEMLESSFRGLSGNIELKDGRLFSAGYEIINIVGKGAKKVGLWTATNGTRMQLDLRKRPAEISAAMTRSRRLLQMRNKTLKIGVPSTLEEFVKLDRNPQTNVTVVTGFSIDVFKASIGALPYKVYYEFIPFLLPDGKMAGSYDDLVEQVFHGKFDAVVGDVTITSNRSLYVDFTLPYTEMGTAMLVKRDSSPNMWIFLRPLTRDLWLVTAAFFFWIGFVVWFIEHTGNDEFRGSASQQIGNTMWFAFSTLVFSHREKLLSNLSKFVVIIWLFVVLILTSSYTATLASMLTVRQFQSLSRDCCIGIPDGNAFENVVSNLDSKDSVHLYGTLIDYADALRRDSKNGGVSAIIDEIPYIKIFPSKHPTQYSIINRKQNTNGFGFVFPKGSPLVPDISKEIARLREEGTLGLMEDLWFKGPSSDSPEGTTDIDADTSALSLRSFGGLFVLSGATSFLAVLVSALHQKWRGLIIAACKSYREHSQTLTRFFSNKIADRV